MNSRCLVLRPVRKWQGRVFSVRSVSHATRRDWSKYEPEPPKKHTSPLFTQYHKWDGSKKVLSNESTSLRRYDLESNVLARTLASPMRMDKVTRDVSFPKALMLKFSIAKDSDDGQLWLAPNIRNLTMGSAGSYIINNKQVLETHSKMKNTFMPLPYLTSTVTMTTVDKVKWNFETHNVVSRLFNELMIEQIDECAIPLNSAKYNYLAARSGQNDRIFSPVSINEHHHYATIIQDDKSLEELMALQDQPDTNTETNYDTEAVDGHSMIAVENSIPFDVEEYYSTLSVPTIAEELGVIRRKRELKSFVSFERPPIKLRLFCLYTSDKIEPQYLAEAIDFYDVDFPPEDEISIDEMTIITDVQYQQNAYMLENPDDVTLDILAVQYEEYLFKEIYNDTYLDESKTHFITAYDSTKLNENDNDFNYYSSLAVHDEVLDLVCTHSADIEEVRSTLVPLGLASSFTTDNDVVKLLQNEILNDVVLPDIEGLEDALLKINRHSVVINCSPNDENVYEIKNNLFHINLGNLENLDDPDIKQVMDKLKPNLFENNMMILPQTTKRLRKFIDNLIRFVDYNR